MSNNSFTDLLKEINTTKATIAAYSPSTKEDIQLAPLTLQQQKSIIESSVDSTLASLFFNNTFFKILKQNLGGDISRFDTVDRVNFALQLRSQLSDSYEKNDTTISVNDILAKNRTIAYTPTEKQIVMDNYTFTVRTPNLVIDDKVNVVLLNKYKNETLNGNKLKTLISDLFVHEILKFIPKLKVNDKEILLHTDLQAAANLLENIDSIKFVQITDYINTIRDTERSFATIPGTDTIIDIIPEFFIV